MPLWEFTGVCFYEKHVRLLVCKISSSLSKIMDFNIEADYLQRGTWKKSVFVLEFSDGFICFAGAYLTKYLQAALQLQVFLEKYGYLHQEDHIHNEVEVQSAIR